MALDKEHLEYPHRSYGMDHQRYDWSMLSQRSAVNWPGGAKLALWVNVSLEFFPLDQQGKPFAVPGGMTMPYPDLRHFTLRDYGNRVGIYRLLKALDQYAVSPTFAINSQLVERTPYLVEKIAARGDEILGHGWNMDSLHYGGMPFDEEAELIQPSLETLRAPELLASNGIRYFCDWVNDDMPYRFRTGSGELVAMPLSNELEDRFILMNNLHSEQSWADQVCDACDFLLGEAETAGGRILGLNIHPWMLGQPHRIGKLEQGLEYIMGRNGVWRASATNILDAWEKPEA